MKKILNILIVCVPCIIIFAAILLFPLFIKNGIKDAPANNPINNAGGAATEQPRLKIAATIFPLYDIAKNVAGEKALVELILPPGASPHTFELAPEQIKKMIDIDVVFVIGHGLDDWAAQVRTVTKKADIVSVDSGIKLLGVEFQEDPHYWLDPMNAKIIGYNIANTLSGLSPEHKDYFSQQAADFAKHIDDLYIDSKLLIESLSNKKILTMHDAWYYFAKSFGLEVVGVYEPSGGEEPTPGHIADLGRKVHENNIKIFFSEPQLSEEGAKAFANDNRLDVRVLDPIGGVSSRNSYEEIIRYNVLEIVK